MVSDQNIPEGEYILSRQHVLTFIILVERIFLKKNYGLSLGNACLWSQARPWVFSYCSHDWWCNPQLHHQLSIYCSLSCKVSAQIQLRILHKCYDKKNPNNYPKCIYDGKPWDSCMTRSDLAQRVRDLGDNKDEHDFCDESKQHFMLMEWVAWSPERETQECSRPHNERGCVTLWAIWTILSSGPGGNEFQLIPSLGGKPRVSSEMNWWQSTPS